MNVQIRDGKVTVLSSEMSSAPESKNEGEVTLGTQHSVASQNKCKHLLGSPPQQTIESPNKINAILSTASQQPDASQLKEKDLAIAPQSSSVGDMSTVKTKQCPMCESSFISNMLLRSHIRQKHGVRVSESCPEYYERKQGKMKLHNDDNLSPLGLAKIDSERAVIEPTNSQGMAPTIVQNIGDKRLHETQGGKNKFILPKQSVALQNIGHEIWTLSMQQFLSPHRRGETLLTIASSEPSHSKNDMLHIHLPALNSQGSSSPRLSVSDTQPSVAFQTVNKNVSSIGSLNSVAPHISTNNVSTIAKHMSSAFQSLDGDVITPQIPDGSPFGNNVYTLTPHASHLQVVNKIPLTLAPQTLVPSQGRNNEIFTPILPEQSLAVDSRSNAFIIPEPSIISRGQNASNFFVLPQQPPRERQAMSDKVINIVPSLSVTTEENSIYSTIPDQTNAPQIVNDSTLVLQQNPILPEKHDTNVHFPEQHVCTLDMNNVVVIKPEPESQPQLAASNGAQCLVEVEEEHSSLASQPFPEFTPNHPVKSSSCALPALTSNLGQRTKTPKQGERKRVHEYDLRTLLTCDDIDLPMTTQESVIGSDRMSYSSESASSDTTVGYSSDDNIEAVCPNSCPKCGKGLEPGEMFTWHLISHQRQEPHRCAQCVTGFSYKEDLNFHLMEKLQKGSQKIGLGDRPKRRRQVEDKKECEGKYECLLCEETMPDLHQLTHHLTQHHLEKLHQCTFCVEGFSQLEDMVDHLITVWPNKTISRQTNQAVKHKPEHVRQTLAGHSALNKTCQTGNIRSLWRELTPSTRFLNPCHYCRLSFTGRDYIQHLATHVKRLRFKCQGCKETFLKTSDANKHIEVCKIHKAEKLFYCSSFDALIECGTCGVMRKTLADIRKHHEVIHRGKIPAMCTKCGIDFAYLHDVTKHLKEEHGDKVLKCGVCSEVLYGSEALARHVDLLHFKKKKLESPPGRKEKCFGVNSVEKKGDSPGLIIQKPYRCHGLNMGPHAAINKRVTIEKSRKNSQKELNLGKGCVLPCSESSSTITSQTCLAARDEAKIRADAEHHPSIDDSIVQSYKTSQHMINEKKPLPASSESGIRADSQHHPSVNRSSVQSSKRCRIIGNKLLVAGKEAKIGANFQHPPLAKHSTVQPLKRFRINGNNSLAARKVSEIGASSLHHHTAKHSTEQSFKTSQHTVDGNELQGISVFSDLETCGGGHKRPEGPGYECIHCGKKFMTVKSLGGHKAVHREKANFVCPVCKTMFNNGRELADHVETHLEERTFICSQCERRFPTAQILKTHMFSHKIEEKFFTKLKNSPPREPLLLELQTLAVDKNKMEK